MAACHCFNRGPAGMSKKNGWGVIFVSLIRHRQDNRSDNPVFKYIQRGRTSAAATLIFLQTALPG